MFAKAQIIKQVFKVNGVFCLVILKTDIQRLRLQQVFDKINVLGTLDLLWQSIPMTA
jgi:hypothetical protein